MAELTPLERLQPALLDRLIDDAPDRKVEAREMRLIDHQRLRAAVLRDLGWLLNATRPGDDDDSFDWEGCPHAERSVLNFGLPALAGETGSTLDIGILTQRIHRAIVDFEPRIEPSSLRVEAVEVDFETVHHNQIQLEIRGNLWAQPTPIELLVRTDVDLETGQAHVRDARGS